MTHDEIDDDMIDQEAGTNSWWDLKFKVEALETALADANERMSKLDFERTAAELERDAALKGAEEDRQEMFKTRAELAAANALLRKWDALINHQFNGSREAMSAMIECAQETAHHLYGPPPWPSRIDALTKGDGDE